MKLFKNLFHKKEEPIRNYIFLYMFLFFQLNYSQDINFNIKYSEPLSVFVFMQNLTENYPENVFKTEFIKSKYNNKQFNEALKEFEKLNIDYSYKFEEFPYETKIPLQSRDLLMKYLLESNTLEDFKKRSIGLIPNKTLLSLCKNIAQFIPIYNELIYEPNKIKFEKQLEEIKNYSKENKIEDFFNMGLLFYNSEWDNSIPIEIAFYPLPNSDSFTAQAFINNFISAIQTNLKDYKDLFSVMLHEVFHILYNEQSLEFKTKIADYFYENKSKNNNYAFLILNEILATSLGNGFVYEKLNGKVDENDWYYQKYINLFSKKTYPLIKEYILENKSIDKIFIDKFIKIYDDNFSNWINELDNIMTYRYIISENSDDINTISKLFWYRSSEEIDSDFSENSIYKMLKTPLTKIIIVTKNNREKLKIIKNSISELKNWKYNPSIDFSYKILLNDNSQLIILNKKKLTIEKLFDKIQKK